VFVFIGARFEALVPDVLYEVNRKVSGLDQKRNAGLSYSVLAASPSE
jgi:hypothetical protein